MNVNKDEVLKRGILTPNYNQEARVIAFLSKDEVMIDNFIKGTDINKLYKAVMKKGIQS